MRLVKRLSESGAKNLKPMHFPAKKRFGGRRKNIVSVLKLRKVATLKPEGNVNFVKGLAFSIGSMWNYGFSGVFVYPYFVNG